MSSQPSAQPQFAVTDRFDPEVMQAFMRRPDVYWSAADALMPPPEAMDFVGHMAHPDVYTLAATHGGHVVGYVQFNKRTSIGAEIHVGFHPQYRGIVAKRVVEYAIGLVFRDKGLLKLWAIVASDNRAAVLGAKAIGFTPEGRLRNAIVRDVAAGGPPLADLIILGLSRQGGH